MKYSYRLNNEFFKMPMYEYPEDKKVTDFFLFNDHYITAPKNAKKR